MQTRILVGVVAAAGLMTVSCTREPLSPTLQTLSAAPASWADGCEETHTCHPPSILNGRMTGGGGAVAVGDVYVTKGFTLHCDITLSNNLEINWPDNKWHLDKPVTSAYCLDDPNISPEPPRAPIDTYIGEATGQLNGVDGSFVRFVLIDSGEPGGLNDMLEIHVYDPNGNLVLDLPLSFVTNGNIQAHEDQPHK